MGKMISIHRHKSQNRPACYPEAEGVSPLQVRDYGVFFKEWLAGSRASSQLPISAVCNSRCLFCSNNFNPFPITRGIFRDIEDVKLQLALMPNQRQSIRMSDSLPGRIAEGEAFLHPEFFSILKLIRRKFPTSQICFTTNGSMLDEAFLRELSKFRPVEITLSMHSTQPGLWGHIFGKDSAYAKVALQALQLIGKYRMDLVGTIVPLPQVCGWADIEHTYATFVSHGAKAMILYRPGYSRCAGPDAIRQMECPIVDFMDFSDRMRDLHRIPVNPHPYLRGRIACNVERILSATRSGNVRNGLGPFRRVIWLTSEAAHDILMGEINRLVVSGSNSHQAFPVPNRTYGGNIIAAGLLMVDDFIGAGKEALQALPDTELFLVPKAPFDSHECDLTGSPAYRIAEELGRPVWVVADDGSFNPLLEGFFESSTDLPVGRAKEAMTRFNLCWKDESMIEQSLDLVAAYPAKTPWGILGRQELREAVARERRRLRQDPALLSQGISLLDGAHALCTERWQTKSEPGGFTRWTFMVRDNADWKIEHFSQGEERP